MLKYLDIENSDFFNFFNIKEKSVINLEKGKEIVLEPGAFQEFIEIKIIVDEKSNIIKSQLILSRNWIGNSENLNVFAQDIAKSFLKDFTAPDDSKKIKNLVDLLFKMHGANQKVYTINPNPEIKDLTQDEKDIILTFLGIRDSIKYYLKYSSLSLINYFHDEVEKLEITIEIIK